jgi:membrane protease YdiL (CAAX protease family)
MKTLITLLFASSFLYSAPDDEFAVFLADENFSQQIISLDLDSPTIPSEIIQLPAPKAIDLPRKSTLLAVGLSSLFPGLGHVYLGDMQTAGGLMGGTGLAIGLIPYGGPLQIPAIVTLQNTWNYGIYAAYRDARLFNGQAGYSYKMPTDSLADLSYAPFNFRILKKPEVWGGFLGALAIAITTSYFTYSQDAHIQPQLSSRTAALPLIALPVGIGEESFFRGYLQSQLSEWLTPWGGIVVSSLAFGASHIPNAQMLAPEDQWRYYAFTLPVITAFGGYFGWLTHKNNSLKESVAVHTWYDFVLFAAAALATQTAATGRSGFAIAIPF